MPEALPPATRRRLLGAGEVPPGVAVPVVIDDADVVVWRGGDGRIGAVSRACPHLDWDLADACAVGDELVCRGHGWSIRTDGEVFKRNEFGREDPKGTTRTWRLVEHDDAIWVEGVT